MVETGALSPAAAMTEAERLRFPPAPSRDAGWFADWVRDGIGDRAPPTADLLLRTTLDSRLQAAVARHGWRRCSPPRAGPAAWPRARWWRSRRPAAR